MGEADSKRLYQILARLNMHEHSSARARIVEALTQVLLLEFSETLGNICEEVMLTRCSPHASTRELKFRDPTYT